MNFKTTLVLLLLLAGVGTYLFVTNKSGDSDQATTPKPEDEKKLLSVAASDVDHVVVAPQGGEKIVFDRKNGSLWRLVEPVKAETDAWQVDSLVREITDLKSRNKVDLKPSETGLDTPRYTVELTDKAGKTTKLAVGAKSAVGDVLYVRLNDEARANIVAGSLVDQLDKPASSYRQPKLVEATQDRIESLAVIHGTQPALKLEKSGADWRVTEPQAMPGEASEVQGLLIALTGLSATEFVAEDSAAKAAQYGLDKPVLTLTFRAKPGPTFGGAPTPATTTQSTTAPASEPAPTVIRFGRYDDVLKKNLFAAVEGGPVVKLPATVLDNFKKAPLELRERKVLDIDPESVDGLTVSRDLQATTTPTKRDASMSTVVLARRQEKFIPAGPPMPALPAKKPDVETPAPGAEKPTAPMPTPTDKPTDAPPAPGAAEKPAEPKTDATGAMAGEAVLAADAQKADTPKPAEPSSPSEAPKVSDAPTPAPAEAGTPPVVSPVTQPAKTQPMSRPAPPPPPPSKWVLESDPKGDAGDHTVQSLLTALHPLRAMKYLDAMPKDIKQAGTYVVKVQIASTSGKPAQTLELRLTDPGMGAVIGEYNGFIFEVDRSLLEKLDADFTKAADHGDAAPPAMPEGFGQPPA